MKTAMIPLLAAAAIPALVRAAEDPLRFPASAFTLETRTIATKKVTYRSYRHVGYVAKPVDPDFQSLDVQAPVEIDGAAVDASRAPILFSIPVGGYMSASNAHPRSSGPPGARPRNTDLALAAGFVVVIPGVRGRDNRAADGTYYGKAPAVIVDLKAAIRYLRHNQGVLPGNTNWIVTTGVSAGGALSALAGASGGSPLFAAYLKDIGAADADDSVFASADFCPILDLDHADMAYEWMYGAVAMRDGKLADPGLSQQLREAFTEYQASLKIRGLSNFGPLTAANYDRYLLQVYLQPAATRYLRALGDEQRHAYLSRNAWISWSVTGGASFTFADYLTHVGRMKALPAFDDFAMRQPEPNEFGNQTTDSRHFTNFSLRHVSADAKAALDAGLQRVVNLMNPMYFVQQNQNGIAGHWWIRMGTSDAHTSLTVPINLAASLENRGKDVDTRLYWDAGHGADEDAADFIAWIGRITGYRLAQ